MILCLCSNRNGEEWEIKRMELDWTCHISVFKMINSGVKEIEHGMATRRDVLSWIHRTVQTLNHTRDTHTHTHKPNCFVYKFFASAEMTKTPIKNNNKCTKWNKHASTNGMSCSLLSHLYYLTLGDSFYFIVCIFFFVPARIWMQRTSPDIRGDSDMHWHKQVCSRWQNAPNDLTKLRK